MTIEKAFDDLNEYLVALATTKLNGDRDRAEDAAATTWLCALRQWDRIADPRSWLSIVLRRTCNDIRRNNKKYKFLEDVEWDLFPDRYNDTPEGIYLAAEAVRERPLDDWIWHRGWRGNITGYMRHKCRCKQCKSAKSKANRVEYLRRRDERSKTTMGAVCN